MVVQNWLHVRAGRLRKSLYFMIRHKDVSEEVLKFDYITLGEQMLFFTFLTALFSEFMQNTIILFSYIFILTLH